MNLHDKLRGIIYDGLDYTEDDLASHLATRIIDHLGLTLHRVSENGITIRRWVTRFEYD